MFSKFGMNPKHFTHVKSDKDKTVLKHKDGHEIVISHNAVSKEIRSVLQAMSGKNPSKDPNGKLVIKDEQPQPIGKVDVRDDIYKSKKLPIKKDEEDPREKLASGGAVKKYAQGTPKIRAEDNLPQSDIPQQELTPFDQSLSDISNKFDSVPAAPIDSQYMSPMAAQSQIDTQQPQGLADRQPAAMPSEGMAPTQPTVPPKDNGLPSNLSDVYGKAYEYGDKAANLTANALTEQAKAENKALEAKQNALIDLDQKFNNVASKNEQDFNAYKQALQDNQIDPDKYWTGWKDSRGNQHEGHSRITAAIGMIMAGFNPTGNPNMAINMLNKDIDRSIDAQKSNLESSHNLYKANLDYYKNMREADLASRMQLNMATQNKIDRAAANAKTPLAAAALNNTKQQLVATYGQQKVKLDAYQTLHSLGREPIAPGQEAQRAHMLDEAVAKYQTIDPEYYKSNIAPYYIPGESTLATRPVNEDTIKKVVAHRSLDSALKEAIDFTKNNSTILHNKLDPKYGESVTRARDLQAKVRESLLNTVYRDSEKGLLNDLVPENLGGIWKTDTLSKLNNLVHSNSRDLNSLRSSVGLPTPQESNLSPKEQSYVDWAKDPRNANNPLAKKTLQKYGIK